MNTVLGTGGLTAREQAIAMLDHVTLSQQAEIRKQLACKDHKYERIAGDLRCVYCGISFAFPLNKETGDVRPSK